MQDRIKELAVKAGGMFDPDFYDIKGGDRTMWLLQPDELERFAQAIARECAEICALHQEGGIGGWKHNTPLDCENAIRARFGI